MIIKLTNASKEFIGKPLLINTRHILTVFETENILDDKSLEIVTSIYTVTQQNWIVKESIETIFLKIKGEDI